MSGYFRRISARPKPLFDLSRGWEHDGISRLTCATANPRIRCGRVAVAESFLFATLRPPVQRGPHHSGI
jgi:hypothetical protein